MVNELTQESPRPIFSLSWVTPNDRIHGTIEDGGAKWLMVHHRRRGWELPGGMVEANESPTQAALRELFEETGLAGRVIESSHELLEGGVVSWVVVDTNSTSKEEWESLDSSLDKVRWMDKPPEGLGWGLAELVQFSEYFHRRSIELHDNQ